jgi:hypothetical protein
MKPKIIFLMALLALVLAAPVMAVNMSISELGYTGPQTIQIYAVNATLGSAVLVGTYNTTSNGIEVPNTDFSVVIKPEASSYLKNPENLLGSVFEFVETNYIGLLFTLFLIGAVLFLGRRR